MEYKEALDELSSWFITPNYKEAKETLCKLIDKIENGTLVEFPYVNIKHKYNERLGKEVDIFNVYYKDVEGDIILCVCLTAEEAEAKLKELQSKE